MTGDPAVPAGPDERDHSQLATISNELVRVYKELFGRGPLRVRTVWADRDVLLCTLEETFTPAEKKLADMGEHQRLREARIFFQHAAEREICAVVERATGRRVKAFVSGSDTRVDVSCEVFYLAPVVEPD